MNTQYNRNIKERYRGIEPPEQQKDLEQTKVVATPWYKKIDILGCCSNGPPPKITQSNRDQNAEVSVRQGKLNFSETDLVFAQLDCLGLISIEDFDEYIRRADALRKQFNENDRAWLVSSLKTHEAAIDWYSSLEEYAYLYPEALDDAPFYLNESDQEFIKKLSMDSEQSRALLKFLGECKRENWEMTLAREALSAARPSDLLSPSTITEWYQKTRYSDLLSRDDWNKLHSLLPTLTLDATKASIAMSEADKYKPKLHNIDNSLFRNFDNLLFHKLSEFLPHNEKSSFMKTHTRPYNSLTNGFNIEKYESHDIHKILSASDASNARKLVTRKFLPKFHDDLIAAINLQEFLTIDCSTPIGSEKRNIVPSFDKIKELRKDKQIRALENLSYNIWRHHQLSDLPTLMHTIKNYNGPISPLIEQMKRAVAEEEDAIANRKAMMVISKYNLPEESKKEYLTDELPGMLYIEDIASKSDANSYQYERVRLEVLFLIMHQQKIELTRKWAAGGMPEQMAAVKADLHMHKIYPFLSIWDDPIPKDAAARSLFIENIDESAASIQQIKNAYLKDFGLTN